MNELLVMNEGCVTPADLPAAPGVRDEIARLARGPRVLGDIGGDGPLLICVGSIHGNEPAGALALDRFFRRFRAAKDGDFEDSDLQGRLVGLVGNLQALAQGRRFLRHDLNRFWSPERTERLRERDDPLEAEAGELRDLDGELRRLFDEGQRHPIYLLDLHTTSGEGPPFANLDDTIPNREFALNFPVTLVVGIEEELAGTLTNYWHDKGVLTLGFEAGQHDEVAAVDHAEAAIWIALEATGVIGRGRREVAAARRLLEEARGSLPHVVEVRHRHPVRPGNQFRMRPGFRNFQTIKAGETLADSHEGEIASPHPGLILMPLYQDQGEDGFFLVRQISSRWLKLSTFLRHLHLEHYLDLLPGVRPNVALPGSYTIDRRRARWFALEIFHLLGYRRHSEAGRYLVMARRAHDR